MPTVRAPTHERQNHTQALQHTQSARKQPSSPPVLLMLRRLPGTSPARGAQISSCCRNPAFGRTQDRQSRTLERASSHGTPRRRATYATTVAPLRDTPILQCTRTPPFCKPTSIAAHISGQWGISCASGESGREYPRYSIRGCRRIVASVTLTIVRMSADASASASCVAPRAPRKS